MSEMLAGSPERERMLRAKMIEALAPFDVPDPEGFADAFVRMSRPVRYEPPAPAQKELPL